MIRRAWLVSAVLFVCPAASMAQSPEDAIRKAEAAMVAAAKAGDKAAYQRLYSDDLRWLNGDGRMLNKSQRIAEVSPNPAFNREWQTQVKIYGNIAVETGRMLYSQNGEKHADLVLRVYVNNGGQWQLLSHSTVANAK